MNMKKITKLLCVAALLLAGLGGVIPAKATKLYATYGTPASEGKWDVETNTYTWTQGYSNLMTIFTFPNGELAQYKSLHLTTSDFTSSYRVCFMNGSTAVATIVFWSAGQKDLVFSERDETKNLDLTTITHISFGGASGSGSIGLTNVYLEKPFELVIDESGKAKVDITDLKASGCFSLNDQTGVLTSTMDEEGAPVWGNLAINFPTEGVDLSSLTGFSMNITGEALFNNFSIGSKGFWSSVTGRGDLAQYMDQVGDKTKVTVWQWNANKGGTMTINSLELQFSAITASNPHYTPLTAANFNGAYCEYHVGEAMSQGSTIYGNGSVVADNYADLSAYDELHITGTPGQVVRLLFNWGSSKDEIIQTLDADGFTSIDLKALPGQQLNAFKFTYDGKTAIITSMNLYKAEVATAYSYNLTGSGKLAPSAEKALADESATGYDASGVTGTGLELTPANPNALFTAGAGVLSNAQNVIVNGTCANLVLTDGYPFKAPVAFTATTASYTTTINAEAGAGTLCLPFAAAIPEGVTAYTLAYTSGDKATATAVENTIPANTPVLLNGSGEATFTGAAAAVAATANNAAGTLTGVFEKTKVAQGSYVLQNLDGGIGFYKVASDDIYVNPFRAYLTAQASASRIAISYDNVATGIQTVAAQQTDDTVYDLQGRRVSAPTKGLYIVGGKKVMMK